MRLRHARRAAPLALILLAGCHHHGRRPYADAAWVRLAAVSGNPAAAYFTLYGGRSPGRLIAIDSPAAGSSELHRSMTAGDMASMRRVDGVDVPAGGVVAFAPGGYHVMLFGVGAHVKAGGTMPLVARFAGGDPVTMTARVVGAGDPPPYGP
ncbi:MAG TPA: copper chaperone PCu(A)C [Sphingomonas sp.]